MATMMGVGRRRHHCCCSETCGRDSGGSLGSSGPSNARSSAIGIFLFFLSTSSPTHVSAFSGVSAPRSRLHVRPRSTLVKSGDVVVPSSQKVGKSKKQSADVLRKRKGRRKQRSNSQQQSVLPPADVVFTKEVRTLALSQYASSSTSNSRNSDLLLSRDNGSNGKRGRLPPWLLQHDHEDDSSIDIADDDDADKEGKITIRTSTNKGPKYSLGLLTTRTGDEPAAVARANVGRLKEALLRHHSYFGDDVALPLTYHGFSKADVDDIMAALKVASRGDVNLMAGAAEFLWLLLSVEENQFMPGATSARGPIELKPQPLFDDNDDGCHADKQQSFNIFTRDTLIASAFHYADCVEARRSGVYGMVSQAVRSIGSTSSFADQWRRQLLPSAQERDAGEHATDADKNSYESDEFKELDGLDDGTVSDPDWAVSAKMMSSSEVAPMTSSGSSNEAVNQFGKNVARIAQATAKIKRAEILAESVAYGKATNSASATPTKSEAETLRGLLLSVSEDWRALTIRSVACLYRLRGIIKFGDGERTHEVIKAAREAIYVYAPLASRLGMHRLKADLEELAFSILYQRQYAATQALYDQVQDMLLDIEEFATDNVEEVLREDEVLMSQVDSIQVSSRVKQKYSLWKKLLKQRSETVEAGQGRRDLSVQSVHDAIALRIILRAKRLSPAENVESMKTREALLCYYVQKLVLQRFPASDVSRMKDYISNPKPNGYQSLHYTAEIFRHGIDWQFEVQVRSAEMHQLAEYGVAAHWEYKVKGPMSLQNMAKSSTSFSTKDKEASSADELVLELEQASKNSNETKVDENEAALSNLEVDEIDIPVQLKGIDVERSNRCSSYIEALTSARDDIKANTVFVFVSTTDSALDGKILSLNSGAKVKDAITEADQRYGIMLGDNTELLCNGQPIQLDDELMNGDVIVVGASGGSDFPHSLPPVDSI